ncbi:MAG TPA: diphosphate--fructose-6-phosphate 1-phosphotransferase [Sediminispirochaeta sp.]|nr:diphosphate--fructose-6-phosphate 1-phosphotransferase [Sediminispirochaeta sp.]
MSPLQKLRLDYNPKLPGILRKPISQLQPAYGERTESADNQAKMKELFPHTYGAPIVRFQEGESSPREEAINIAVVLSGGQAPGGHNVIAGIYDAMKAANPDSKLFGFLGGPSGILENRLIELSEQYIAQFRNTGGFDIIGSGRTKIELEEQFKITEEVCKKNGISALVIIGGDDSNTNAAILAEYFKKEGSDIVVVGVPKTIDGDLKNEQVEVSFGFDTATKTFSELIGNIMRDAKSAKKYWHFIRLMGRSASHICLECALRTQPNVAIISEEVEQNHTTLNEIVDHIVEVVVKRSQEGYDFGVVLVPEGLIEFIPEVKVLISELNALLADHAEYFSTLHTYEDQSEWINKNLSRDASYVFSSLPNNIQRQLLMDRDPHGNVQVSRIETEKLLIEMVEDNINELKTEKKFDGKFSPLSHFFGYEGRAAFPSNFDANYTYSLGYNAYLLLSFGLSGYISAIQNLHESPENWIPGGVPITMMMNLEMRHGRLKPVIKKALVELQDRPFKTFAANRDSWSIKTSYAYPGAIQYFGPEELCDQPPMSLELEKKNG